MARFCVEHGTSEAEHLSHQDFATEVAAGRMSRFDYLHTDKDGRTHRDILFTVAGEEWRAQASLLVLEYLYTHGWCIEFDWLEARLFGLTKEDAARVAKAEWEGRGRTTDLFHDV